MKITSIAAKSPCKYIFTIGKRIVSVFWKLVEFAFVLQEPKQHILHEKPKSIKQLDRLKWNFSLVQSFYWKLQDKRESSLKPANRIFGDMNKTQRNEIQRGREKIEKYYGIRHRPMQFTLAVWLQFQSVSYCILALQVF